MNEIIKFKKIREELKQQLIKEDELFDNAKDIKARGVHLNNVNTLHVKLGAIQHRINKLSGVEEEDLIKSDYAKEGEYSFGGIFHDEETDYSLKEEEC